MKKTNILLPFLILGIGLSIVPSMSAQDLPEKRDLFEVVVLKQDGTPITEKDRIDNKKLPDGFEFRYKDQSVRLRTSMNPKAGVSVSRVESALLKDGSIGIGLRFLAERHLPGAVVKENVVQFKNKEKSFLAWTGKADFVSPPPRKKLDISLAEYGGNDKWIDVTAKVRQLQVNDSLDFQAGNALFGDPVGGVVKSFILTYTLSDENDEDETIETFSENSRIRIQANVKDQYFRLSVKGNEAFEFVFGNGKLPEKLPTLKP